MSSLQMGKVGPNMVRELDPDAPHRTGRQLHSLDQEDEARLVRALFGCVRCGLLEDGQELCARVGLSWPAATLEGWKPYHDPNYERGTDGAGDKLPAEGNKHRDVWKMVASASALLIIHIYPVLLYMFLAGSLVGALKIKCFIKQLPV